MPPRCFVMTATLYEQVKVHTMPPSRWHPIRTDAEVPNRPKGFDRNSRGCAKWTGKAPTIALKEPGPQRNAQKSAPFSQWARNIPCSNNGNLKIGNGNFRGGKRNSSAFFQVEPSPSRGGRKASHSGCACKGRNEGRLAITRNSVKIFAVAPRPTRPLGAWRNPAGSGLSRDFEQYRSKGT